MRTETWLGPFWGVRRELKRDWESRSGLILKDLIISPPNHDSRASGLSSEIAWTNRLGQAIF